MIAWLLVYSWMEYGNGSWYARMENVVPGIATEEECNGLGKKLTADKTDRPKFRCVSYQASMQR